MEKSNNDLFELMTKMYSEMQGIKSEILEVKKEVLNTNSRLDDFSSDIGKMVTNEVADELSKQLKEIKTDVKFVKHKVQETEEDVFTIQSHLEIIK